MSYGQLLGMIFFLTATLWGQTTSNPSSVDAAHYPQVTHAELPLYPPIARSAHISGTVEIQVLVEKGIVDAQVKSVVIDPTNGVVLNEEGKKKISAYLSNPSLTNLKTWQFQSEDRRAFVVRYVYRIEGEETPVPENPSGPA